MLYEFKSLLTIFIWYSQTHCHLYVVFNISFVIVTWKLFLSFSLSLSISLHSGIEKNIFDLIFDFFDFPLTHDQKLDEFSTHPWSNTWWVHSPKIRHFMSWASSSFLYSNIPMYVRSRCFTVATPSSDFFCLSSLSNSASISATVTMVTNSQSEIQS